MNKEELIFQLEKETPILNSQSLYSYLIKKYKIPEELGRKLVIRITNYQINKYGEIASKRVTQSIRGEI